ncbi:MAG: SinI family restriction endonuclease [Nostoc sp.]|uniref:SinI family restriction endonuclease n=1 Tax=Nostoc sp. TaxID=1180 RepID=UPI002FF8E5E2
MSIKKEISNKKIFDFNSKEIISYAERTATDITDMSWNDSVKTVLSVCCDSPTLFPEITSWSSNEDYITKWLKKYFGGYKNRPSKRTSKKIGTVSDKILDTIISVRLPTLSTDGINHIKYAHRLSMSAENILGLLLEEYLAEKLSFYGWYCAWGETINKVDFCTKKGELLQVKNRSNSENSSSSSVREGTIIRKWHRVNAQNGAYYWKELNQLIGCANFSEEDFAAFVRQTIAENPAAFYVEDSNYWQQIQ